MSDESPEPGPTGSYGPFNGWGVEYLPGIDGDEVALTMFGDVGCDNLVFALGAAEAEELGAALVQLTTGRRPEWCVPEGEPYTE